MAFEPFDFTYVPPATVQPPSLAATSPQVLTVSTLGTLSNAGRLISQLNDLTSMSQYLQGVIVSRTNQTAIEVDAAADPVTSKALVAIYGVSPPPNYITIAMYNQLLDAHMGAQQLEMAVGLNSNIQPNPMQVADLATTVSAVNTHLIASPSYNNWLPLQLASLKSDAIVFQSWATALATYPATYAQPTTPTTQPAVIQASTLDLSPTLNTYQSDVVTRFSKAYAAVYQSLATPSPVEQDVSCIMKNLFGQSLSSMLRISGMFGALQGLAHKASMATLTGDMINFSFARLASDTSSMLASCDQLSSLAVAPLQGALGPLGQILSAANQQAMKVGTVLNGAMAGMSNANYSVYSSPNNVQPSGVSTLSVPGVGPVCEGVKQLAETMNWGQSQIQGSLSLLDKSFRQLVERRLSQQNDRQSLMDSQRAMDTITGLVSGVTNQLQTGTLTSNPTPQQQQDAANAILTSLQTSSGTTFVTSGNQVIVNAPDMPPAPTSVQNVLTTAKIVIPQGVLLS